MILRLVSRGPWITFALLGLMLLPLAAGGWYKQKPNPKFHTVGRAAGLLLSAKCSPYKERRELEEESASGVTQWQRLQRMLKVEDKPRRALDQRSKVGPWKGNPSKRTLSHQASARSRTGRGLLDALRNPGIGLTPQMLPLTIPKLLKRAMRTHE